MKLSALSLTAMAGALLCASLLFVTCSETTPPPPPVVTNQPIRPVPLPTNIVPGFVFPQDSNVIINQWLGGFTAAYFDTVSIYNHAWGIWAGLTAKSGQQYNGQELLVYETWPGITDIQDIVKTGNKTTEAVRSGFPKLMPPRQFSHAAFLRKGKVDPVTEETPGRFWVTVSYDPTAAKHTIQNSLLDSNVLKAMVTPGKIKAIPSFPNTAITLKPSYLVGKGTDSLIQIPAWPGPPSPAMDYPDTAWHTYVYVDVKNGQPAGKVVTPVKGENPTPQQIKAATCNLSDFIYFKLDQAAANYINQQQGSQGVTAKAGDLALLVAMHVTSKEIPNWTWQTFFWAPDPANPPFPSDRVAAALRPKQLQGAAGHYALSTAYAMTRPNQPVAGGNNKDKKPVIGYNPYLEPGLGAINSKSFPNRLNPQFQWGVQSNCMSCHSLACYPTNQYTADQYISMGDPLLFNGKVQLDFAWSIQGNLTGGPASAVKK
jgi:hypothetical protein